MPFSDILASLPAIDHLRALDVVDAAGATVHSIPNAPGKAGSLRLYNALAENFGGALSHEAVEQGLQWFAEHVADAQARPGAHPNIDLLLQQQQSNSGWKLVPQAA